LLGQGIPDFNLLQPEERTVPHKPGTGLGVVVRSNLGRAQAGPQGVEIPVAFRPIAVRISFQQLVLRNPDQRPLVFIRIGYEGCRGQRIDPERFAAQSLEEGGNIERFVSYRETEPVGDLWHGRITDGYLIQGRDLAVAGYVAVLDVATHVLPKVLTGRSGHLGVVHKQPFGNVSPHLVDWVTHAAFPPFFLVFVLFINQVFAGGVGKVTHYLDPQVFIDYVVIVELDVNSARGGFSHVRLRLCRRAHFGRGGGTRHQDVLTVVLEYVHHQIRLVKQADFQGQVQFGSRFPGNARIGITRNGNSVVGVPVISSKHRAPVGVIHVDIGEIQEAIPGMANRVVSG